MTPKMWNTYFLRLFNVAVNNQRMIAGGSKRKEISFRATSFCVFLQVGFEDF